MLKNPTTYARQLAAFFAGTNLTAAEMVARARQDYPGSLAFWNDVEVALAYELADRDSHEVENDYSADNSWA